MAQLVKNLPEMWETWVQSLDWEDPLEKGKATHSKLTVTRTEEQVDSLRLCFLQRSSFRQINMDFQTTKIRSLTFF